MRVFIRPTRTMNASPEGYPLDTQIRVMQVRSLDRLEETTIRELWNNTHDVLGPDLITSSKHTVQIGRGIDLSLNLAAQAQFLVVTAWLRNPVESSYWQAVRIPTNYKIGVCEAEASEMPDPCMFVSIGERGVSMGLQPPASFRTAGIQARCPSLLLLHAASNPTDT